MSNRIPAFDNQDSVKSGRVVVGTTDRMAPVLEVLMHREVYLVRVEDDGSHTDIGQYGSLTAAVADGEEITAYQDYDFSYEVYSLDGTRLAQIHPGRKHYREWARRCGRLDTIHALDDKLDHDVDELVS